MEKAPPRPERQKIEHWQAPELFADELMGLFTADGCVHVTLGVKRVEYTPKGGAPSISTVTCGRLVLPLKAAASLMDQLSATFAQLQKEGVVRRVAQPPPAAAAPTTKVN
jgi:hypothetical protein